MPTRRATSSWSRRSAARPRAGRRRRGSTRRRRDRRLRDLTLRIFMELADEAEFRHERNLGIVLQAYLKDAEADARRLIAWARRRGTPVSVRLVKGAYWDYETAHAELEHWPVP